MSSEPSDTAPTESAVEATARPAGTSFRKILFAAFALSGMAALIYEVVWTRALALILGSTTYAVSTMLSTFMAGLALGGFLGGKLADRRENLIPWFAGIEVGIGVFGLLTLWIINVLPPLYFAAYEALHVSPTGYFLFQFGLCFLVMLVPTTLMGATFPIVSKAVTQNVAELGQRVGNAYSFNTVGAIVGSASAGFLLIPALGLETTTLVAAGINLAGAALVLGLSRTPVSGKAMGIVLAAFALSATAALASQSDTRVLGFYVADRYDSYEAFLRDDESGEVLFDGWYRDGRVRMIKEPSGFVTLEHGGRFEGSSPADVPNVMLIALLPIAARPSPQSFLGIGLGTGFTVATAKQLVPDVHVVEINRGVVEAVGTYGPPGVLDGVTTHANDGRHHVATLTRQFDIIASQPSYPTEASAANLFTREYYEAAARALTPNGIYCQWLPYYAMSNDDVTMMIKTFAATFPEVFLFKVEHSLDLIMIGSRQPFSLSGEQLVARVRELNPAETDLPFVLSRTPQQIREVVAGHPQIPVNTDDHNRLEHHAALNYLTRFADEAKQAQ